MYFKIKEVEPRTLRTMRQTQRFPHNVFFTDSQTFSSPVRKIQNPSFPENRIQEDGGTEHSAKMLL